MKQVFVFINIMVATLALLPRVVTFPYLAWDNKTFMNATLLLPPNATMTTILPLIVSPHGRNVLGHANCVHYWQYAPVLSPGFAVLCPDGMGRAHNDHSDPFNEPPSNPGLFSYAYAGHLNDLLGLPLLLSKWVLVDRKRIFVMGSSMGGLETLMLAVKGGVSGIYSFAGAAAFDSPCDLVVQASYLTRDEFHKEALTAVREMLAEVGHSPTDTIGWNVSRSYFDRKLNRVVTIDEMLHLLRTLQAPWDARAPLSHVEQLSRLAFPLRIYWSRNDTVVGNQERDQSGKLFRTIISLNPKTDVSQVVGNWEHSTEFHPQLELGDALLFFGLINSRN
jgi:pimeloyl-ACP methyl ester carboxylesterase